MEIRPFRGWRYQTSDGDVSRLIAPPYDVLSGADKAALLAQDGRNIVAVDLPHVPPRDVGPPEAYRAAAALLERWKRSGLLSAEPAPALYAYEQAFQWAGKSHVRRAMICGVRATELGKDVIPHEHTFSGPKADRLALTEATRAQMSPIFGFYDDPSGASEALWSVAADVPPMRGKLRQITERLWPVTAPDVIEEMAAALLDVPVFIADGHHRYTTALTYRNSLGKIPRDHPPNPAMFAPVPTSDPGLIILPTHRILTGLKDFDVRRFVEATSKVMKYKRVRLERRKVVDADGYLRGFGPHAMALAGRGDRAGAYVGVPRDVSAMRRAAPEQSPAWQELDVSILHRLLIDHHLTDCRTAETFIDYTADGPAAVSAVRTGRADMAVFLQATPLVAVRRIALAGEHMPHKSTYFYPKPATGMVLYPLDD